MRRRGGFPRIANIYGGMLGGDATDVELELLARYDLLIGGIRPPRTAEERRRLADRVRRLRELNPAIIIIDFSISAPYWDRTAADQPPEDAFLRTVSGERVEGWPGYEMLNFASPATPEFLAAQVSPRLDGLGLDGCFIDCMFDHFDAWAVDIERRRKLSIDADGDGREDAPESLDRAWKLGKTRLLERVRASLGEEVVVMVNAQKAGDFCRPYVNGNYLEDYVDYVSTSNWDWKGVLDLYRNWCRTDHMPNVTTINSTSLHWPEYDAPRRLPVEECCAILDRGYQQLQQMRFGLATSLMADGFFGFDLNTRWRGQQWWYPEFDAPLGEARGECHASADGTWRREFERGFALVNPQAHRVKIRFERPYRDFTTGWSGREFSMPERDGRIFFPVSG